jgi:two-component system chemotaxis response regulator CheB
VVALGASTGGPKLLAEVLGGLPRGLPASVLLVQHLPNGFHEGFVHWLNQEIALPVSIATDGDALVPGKVLVAPGERHLEVLRLGSVRLLDTPPIGSHRPSATRLFESLAQTYGANSMGVILTGMGRDGADGLVALRKVGGLCIAQDEASSLIFGMPRSAIEAGAVDRVLSPGEIVGCILENVGGTG